MVEIARIGEYIDLSRFDESHYFHSVNRFFQTNIAENNYRNFVVVNGVPIHYEPSYHRISVNLSAGADSTMLTYILCMIIEHLGTGTQILPTSIVRYYDAAEFSEKAKERVYGWLKQRFPNIIGEHIWGFIPPAMEFTPLSQLNLQQREHKQFAHLVQQGAGADVLYFIQFNEWATRKYGFQAMYNGTTTNPVNTVIPNVPHFRDNFDLSQTQVMIQPENICPFTYMEKNWVTAQYDNFGVQDLFALTQSCESVAGGCNRLDHCFHCAERKWSEDQKHLFLNK